MTDAIQAERITATIKWPTDVLVGDRRVASAATSSAASDGPVDYVNLNVDRATLRTALGASASGATSLSEVAGRPIDRNAFAARFLNFLERWIDTYRADGPEAVVAAWRERDGLRGRFVEVRDEETSSRGIARGVSDDGALLLEDAQQRVNAIATGEVILGG